MNKNTKLALALALGAFAIGIWGYLYISAQGEQAPAPTRAVQTEKPAAPSTPATAAPKKKDEPAPLARALTFELPPMFKEAEKAEPPIPLPGEGSEVVATPIGVPPGNPFEPFPEPEPEKPKPAPKPAAKAPPVPKAPPPPPEPPPPPKAVIEIYTDPPGAKVYIDGKLVGVTPLRAKIEPGDHALLIEAEGREPITKAITAKPGAEIALTFWLPPAKKAPAEVAQKPEQKPPEIKKPQPNPAEMWVKANRVRLRGIVLGPVPVALLEVGGEVVTVTPGDEIIPGSGARLVGVTSQSAIIAYENSSVILFLEKEKEVGNEA